MHRTDLRRITAGLTVALVSVAALTGCSSGPEVSYAAAPAGTDTLRVYVGPGAYRDTVEYAVKNLLPDAATIELVDAPADANARVVAGDADLAFYQDGPTFETDAESWSSTELSVVSTVDVVPYGLYSSRWTDLTDTTSWVNTGIVADEITGQSLPHGGKVVLPAQTDFDYARGLYLLQSAGLVKLDRPLGGSAPADLTITDANVVDSLRHLSLLAQYSTEHYPEIYQQYDAVVLSPEQATAIGLDPATDALAVEQGPGNPFASVLVAPSRLAGDPRVLELTHALESPELAAYLKQEHPATIVPVTAAQNP